MMTLFTIIYSVTFVTFSSTNSFIAVVLFFPFSLDFLSIPFFTSSNLFIKFCNLFVSFPICSQSLLCVDVFKLLFAFIIKSASSSKLSVFSISISTAYCETRFESASLNVFPIATLFPDATHTFFSTGNESVSFTNC